MCDVMEPKSKVFVKSLKQEGVILEKYPNGLYKVAIGVMQVERPEKDLKILVDAKSSKSPTTHSFSQKSASEKRRAEMPLDLHGLRVDEALEILSKKLDEAILADVDSLAVIHGLGTGALLSAVHKFLREQPTVKHFKVQEGNPGTTLVYF